MKLTRQWPKHPLVWRAYLRFLFDQREFHRSSGVLRQALGRLHRSEHVALIQAHAQLEFELGDPERGRTSFENVLSNFPKRSDVWSSYLDVEIKRLKKLQQQSKKNSKAAQQVLLIRQLFERVVSMKFGARGMKSLFKKFLSFEQEHGTEDTELAVQQRAKEYVLSKTVST